MAVSPPSSVPNPPPTPPPKAVEAWLEDIRQADSVSDARGLRAAREGLVAQHPTHDAAAEALYKLGLDQLFVQRHLDRAVELFEAAIRCRHVFWSPAARTSYGLCLLRQNRGQKALFELRKVAYVTEPTAHSVVALSFIEMVAMQEGQPEEVRRVRKERILQLEQRVAKVRGLAGGGNELLSLLLQLAQALDEQGEPERAKPILAEVRAAHQRGQTGEFERSVLDALR